MLHEIGVELGVALVARGFPLKAFPVVDGPEPSRPAAHRERIVIEHGEADNFGPVLSQRSTPKHVAVRGVAAKATIYAQSVGGGATDWEHRRRAEHVLDMVLVGLRDVCVARKQGVAFRSGRFVRPEDLAKSEASGGAVYELLFVVDRGVYVQDWNGDVAPTAELGAVNTTDEITGPAHSTPETAC